MCNLTCDQDNQHLHIAHTYDVYMLWCVGHRDHAILALWIAFMQVHTAATNEVSFLPYEVRPREEIKSYYHELGALECNGSWLRFRCEPVCT